MMLFGFSADATTDNWIHECVVNVVRQAHADALEDDSSTDWPDLLPDPYRDRLASRTALRDRIADYRQAIAGLGLEEHNQAVRALTEQNEIADLLSERSDCERMSDFPEALRGPLARLFETAFRLLGAFRVRDEQYRIIYDRLKDKVCPFCGCEYFDAAGAPREDLDHYLARSIYPFAAANLLNLVPMGHKCNARYKSSNDMLLNAGRVRRKAFNPYDHPVGIEVDLNSSALFAGNEGNPKWVVELLPDTAEARTWDDVFGVRERYVRDVLDPHYKTWLGGFGAWCLGRPEVAVADAASLAAALSGYVQFLDAQGHSDRAFLKAAVFKMLHHSIDAGNERLVELLLGIVAEQEAATA